MLKLKIKVLSPIHISNGNDLSYGIHYFVNDKKFYKFHFSRIAQFLSETNSFPLDKSTGHSEIVKKIISKFSDYDKSCFEYEIDTQNKFSEDVVNLQERFGEMEVKEFINSNGKFYVPGSSIKGAILTAVRKPYLGINPDRNQGNYIEERFIINDSNFISNDNFCVFETNMRSTTPRKIKAYFICLMPNVKFEIIIQKNGKLQKENLIDALNSYSSKQIKEVRKYLETYIESNDDSAKLFSDSLNYIIKKSDSLKANEAIINIGLGGGNWFKTVNDKPSDRPGHTSFSFGEEEKLRHMGWCKVEVEEANV
jgi:CRISPR-associated protein Csm5